MISKKLVAASILAAMGTSSAYALDPIKVGQWDLTLSGSVNGYYTQTKCDQAGVAASGTLGGLLTPCGGVANSQSAANVQNGLLPGFLVFTAATKQNGYDLKGVISIDPGTTNSANNGLAQTVGDNRRVYLTVGTDSMGTFKIGRDIGMFGQNAILNDMSLLAVGGGAGLNGAINTTLGSIGSGYIYTEFQPQVSYTSPNMGGLQLSAGIFQPRRPLENNTGAFANETNSPALQAMATYTVGSAKLWGALINQKVKANAAGVRDLDTSGYEAGGTIGFGALQLTGNYFSGSGLGTGIIGVGGFDSAGNKRDSDGYLAQATYKIGDTKLGINYGESQLDRTSADTAATNPTDMLKTNKQAVLGVYHNLTPSLTIAAEYIDQKQDYQFGARQSKSNTFAVGAILFF
ncbi:MAG: porin [Limnobacter sp.]|uniref:porin n=1 Tax=Limnobacter sp. TaxID=2003368 RepID=UPI00391C9F40